jgi:hypothetical protein
MKAIKNYSVILNMVLLSLQSFGQTYDQQIFDKVTPVSPEVASLFKFTETPVSLYTGTPDISIPLYTIKVDEVELPITLKYRANGIKVDEEASWVGLGWDLSVGGAIFRQVNHRPDDDEYGIVTTGILGGELQVFDKPDTYFPTEYSGGYSNTNIGKINGVNKKAGEIDWLNGTPAYDFEPDMFSYSIPGKSGKFSFDKYGEIVLYEPGDIKIEFGFNFLDDYYIDTFTIIDENGTKYFFSQRQEFQPFNEMPFTQAWLITRITTTKGKTINFEYFGEDVNIMGLPSFSDIEIVQPALSNPYYNSGVSNGLHTSVYLSKITFDQGTVTFNLSGDNVRKDVAGGYYLTSLEVKDKNSITQKKYSFDYNYFIAVYDQKVYNRLEQFGGSYLSNLYQYSGSVSEFLTHRLKLNNVTEVASTGVALNPYKFDYNSTALPSKLSYATDYWGYYNRKVNTTSIPSVSYNFGNISRFNCDGNDDYMLDQVTYTRADKTPDSIGTNACVLNQITYPTKGYTKFYYSLNSFNNTEYMPFNIGNGAGLRVRQIDNYDNSSNLLTSKKYTYSSGLIMQVPINFKVGYGQEHTNYCIGLIYSDPCGINGCQVTYYPELTLIYLTSNSMSPLSCSAAGNYVGYSKVEEITGDYKTEYNYSQIPETSILITSRTTHFQNTNIPPAWGDNTNGTLIKKVDYDNNNNIKRNINYSYTPAFGTLNYGVITKAFDGIGIFSMDGSSESFWVISEYAIQGKWNRLDNVTETIDGVTTITTYSYGSSNHHLPTQISKSTSMVNESLITKYKYPLDFSRIRLLTPVNDMQDKHMINYPIEIQELKNDKITNSTFNLYSKYNSNIPLLSKIYQTELTSPVASASFYGIDEYGDLVTNTQYVLKHIIDYDDSLNISGVQKSGDIKTSYLWGYNNSLPIAKANNSEYGAFQHENFEEDRYWLPNIIRSDNRAYTGKYSARIAGNGGSHELTRISSYIWPANTSVRRFKFGAYMYATTDQAWIGLGYDTGKNGLTSYAGNWTRCTKVGDWVWVEGEFELPTDVEGYAVTSWYVVLTNENGSGVVYVDDVRLLPQEAEMTTYTYKPLIGIASVTDASAKTSFYHYDAFGRLEKIVDHNNNVVKQYEYHYRDN